MHNRDILLRFLLTTRYGAYTMSQETVGYEPTLHDCGLAGRLCRGKGEK